LTKFRARKLIVSYARGPMHRRNVLLTDELARDMTYGGQPVL